VRSAVVVGAGVGGLAAAGALARSGWHVTLLERGERLRSAGAALLLWPNGLAALDALGLGPGLGDIVFPLATGGFRRHDGRWLVRPANRGGSRPADRDDSRDADRDDGRPAANGSDADVDHAQRRAENMAQQPVVVHADDLHDTLMAGLGERTEIRTGIEVTSIRAGTAERPGVGTGKHTFEGDLVVAADGSQSMIRKRLAPGSSVVSAGYTAWRAVIPWYRAPRLADAVPLGGEMLGAGQRFLHAMLGERGSAASSTRGGIYWAATVPGAKRPESAATQLALLRRWFADWQAPVGELLEATEPDDLVQQAGEELRPLPRRFGFPVGQGGFVLLGDAAHVATPNLAQGACLAFEDAATLGALLAGVEPGPSLVAALDAYTQTRRARVARVAKASRRVGRVLQAQGWLAVQARDIALGRLSSRLLDRASASATEWTPPPSAP
jgi:2-polyprenyl-6-methoxyphenol hydroxylase-like FAD-dependent oxidoreductase